MSSMIRKAEKSETELECNSANRAWAWASDESCRADFAPEVPRRSHRRARVGTVDNQCIGVEQQPGRHSGAVALATSNATSEITQCASSSGFYSLRKSRCGIPPGVGGSHCGSVLRQARSNIAMMRCERSTHGSRIRPWSGRKSAIAGEPGQ